MGFRVLAVEPHPSMADRLEQRFAPLISARAPCAWPAAPRPSARGEDADLYVGSATTVSSLEGEWTTVGFPEEFRRRQSVRVPLRRVDELVRDFTGDAPRLPEGRRRGPRIPALRGCFSRGAMARPAVVMFEAFSRFPERRRAVP